MVDAVMPTLQTWVLDQIPTHDEFTALFGPTGGLRYVQRALEPSLVNKTANGSLVLGDVVVQDPAVAGQVITTTTSPDTRSVFVCRADVGAGLSGDFLGVGFCRVNVTGSVAIDDRLCTSTTAKKARTAASGESAFGRAITADAAGQVLAEVWAGPSVQVTLTVPSEFSVSGSPLTGVGTLAITKLTVPTLIMHSVADQALSNATNTPIAFDTDDTDTDAMHFTSASNLTGTVAKTAASATLVGTGTLFTSELSVGQIIDVPGTAVERRVVTAIANNLSLTVAVAYVNTASGQTATRVNSAFVFRTAGLYFLHGMWAAAANATGDRQVFWRVNGASGTNYPPFEQINLGASRIVYVPTTTLHQAAQWDYAELIGWQNSTGSLNSDGFGTLGINVPGVAAYCLNRT